MFLFDDFGLVRSATTRTISFLGQSRDSKMSKKCFVANLFICSSCRTIDCIFLEVFRLPTTCFRVRFIEIFAADPPNKKRLLLLILSYKKIFKYIHHENLQELRGSCGQHDNMCHFIPRYPAKQLYGILEFLSPSNYPLSHVFEVKLFFRHLRITWLASEIHSSRLHRSN